MCRLPGGTTFPRAVMPATRLGINERRTRLFLAHGGAAGSRNRGKSIRRSENSVSYGAEKKTLTRQCVSVLSLLGKSETVFSLSARGKRKGGVRCALSRKLVLQRKIFSSPSYSSNLLTRAKSGVSSGSCAATALASSAGFSPGFCAATITSAVTRFSPADHSML